MGDNYQGITLPPVIIFKNLLKAPNGNFPREMIVVQRAELKRTLMKDSYAQELWKRGPGCFLKQLWSLLIMDSAKSYLGDVPDSFTKCNTECNIIDGGMTPLLQLIDTHINKSFKDILKVKWTEWIASGVEEFTHQGNRRRASYELIANWIFETWKSVVNDFQQCGHIGWDGDHQKLHSRLHDTILNRSVQSRQF